MPQLEHYSPYHITTDTLVSQAYVASRWHLGRHRALHLENLVSYPSC